MSQIPNTEITISTICLGYLRIDTAYYNTIEELEPSLEYVGTFVAAQSGRR